jgi:glycosyltransferase involved in cell wall biosynthesis
LSDLLFSIVIACHNQRDYVRESVQSALSQGHPGKEVIVVDDASNDGTADVLRSFGDSITLAALTVNGGACAARNHGVSLAKGRYVVFLDGDDVLMPWTLDVYSRLVEAHHPKLILGKCVLCHHEIPHPTVNDAPREIRFVTYRDFLSKDRHWIYNTSCLVVERAAFDTTDGWTPEIFFQDIQDFLNKMGNAGKTLLLLSPNTVWYRMHTTNASGRVQAFVKGIYILLDRAKAGLYPGGQKFKTKRAAWFGGLIFYWVKEAWRIGLYRDALRLLFSKGWMIVWASVRRGWAWIRGRQPVEIIRLEEQEAAEPVMAMR